MNCPASGDVKNPSARGDRARRRSQFSLKALLGFTASIGIALGCWHIVASYAQYIDGVPVGPGEAVRVKGRFVRILGPRESRYCVYLERAHGWIEHVEDGQASRHWLCAYPIDLRVAWRIEPGNYGLILHAPNSSDSTFIYGRLEVAP